MSAQRALGARVPVPAESPWTLVALGEPRFAVVVGGEPQPQGSKSARVMRGRAVLFEDNKDTEPWRKAVAAVAAAALPSGWVPMDGPLVADLVLTLPKPKDRPKTLRVLPSVKPDLDKLMRAVLDALTRAGVIHDDARLVATRRLDKVYERDEVDSDALMRPGAVIRVWPVPAEMLGKCA